MRHQLTMALIAGALLTSAQTFADSPHADETHPHHAAGEVGHDPQFVMPATYQAAVDEIDARVHAIHELIDGGKLEKLHHEAAVIKRIADGMSKLVAAPDSGVPKEAQAEVLVASKRLSTLFTSVDAAGDSGDAVASVKAHDELAAQVKILRKYAPAHEAATYACPMCPGVSSTTPGRCPKCGMDLVKKTKP